MDDTTELLTERAKTHGSFANNAMISLQLKAIFHNPSNNVGQAVELRPIHKEALDMIALKLSRILSGQANFKDHWRDCAGYAMLAEQACD